MPRAHFKTYVIENTAKQRHVVVSSQRSRVNVMQDYSEPYGQVGKKATTIGEQNRLFATASMTEGYRRLPDADHCFTMTPQAIRAPPGASFVGGSGRYLSRSSCMTNALPS